MNSENKNNNLSVNRCDYSHQIKSNDNVIRTDLGKYSRITYISNPNKKLNIKKLTKNEYIDLSSGELKQYNLNKPTSKSSVNRKLKKYEDIVLFNFQGGASELFITLTCRDNVTDISLIKQYYNKFLINLKKDYKDVDYIALFEQTELMCWHIHLFIKNNKHKRLYIPHNDLLRYWKQGAVYVMSNRNVFQALGHSKTKRNERLERFTFFPKGERMYHKSQGIKIPIKEKMKFKDCPEYDSDKHKKVSSKTYQIKNVSNDKVVNTIVNEMYKQSSTPNKLLES